MHTTLQHLELSRSHARGNEKKPTCVHRVALLARRGVYANWVGRVHYPP